MLAEHVHTAKFLDGYRQPVMLYAAPDGSPTNSGTRASPYDVVTAAAAMLPGDTLILLDGIYSIITASGVTFGDAYATANNRITVRADTGARPIITGNDGYPANITFLSHTDVSGIWFGGTYNADLYPDGGYAAVTVRSYCNVSGNTFWGYLQAILQTDGWHDDLYQNNRFVRTGSPYCHAFYITDQDPTEHQTNAWVRDNILVRQGSGASVDIYREADHCEVSGNFLDGGSTGSGLYLQTEDDLVFDNYLGRSGGPTYGIVSIGNVAERVDFHHNFIVGACSWPNEPISPIFIHENTYFNQAATAYDTAPIEITTGQEVALLGMSEADIDAVCAALETCFSQTTVQIHDDLTIEGYFATLQAVMAAWKAT